MSGCITNDQRPIEERTTEIDTLAIGQGGTITDIRGAMYLQNIEGDLINVKDGDKTIKEGMYLVPKGTSFKILLIGGGSLQLGPESHGDRWVKVK